MDDPRMIQPGMNVAVVTQDGTHIPAVCMSVRGRNELDLVVYTATGAEDRKRVPFDAEGRRPNHWTFERGGQGIIT